MKFFLRGKSRMRDIEKKLLTKLLEQEKTRLTKLYIKTEEDTEAESIIGMKRDLCIETLNKIKREK
tara:strand:- start:187 stop:384 length:198 start_codon:yes stop_codon:yes gene_type:complete